MKHHTRRPAIAVTPDLSGEGAQVKYELNPAYAEAVLRAGGLPYVVPVTEDRTIIEAFFERMSGVVITGGAFDIPPSMYGEEPREGMGSVKIERSNFELALLRAAISRQVPVLGICGGMQLINVAMGGTLFQDLKRELPDAKPHEQPHDRSQPQHPIEVRDTTLLAEAVGKGPLMVNSTHHQAVKTVGAGLIVSAIAPDGVIEAIEARTPSFLLGVQWHPERMIDSLPMQQGIYKLLVARARERRY